MAELTILTTQEKPRPNGFRVVVEKPQEIYSLIKPTVTPQENSPVTIEETSISDRVCNRTNTTMTFYPKDSDYNPSTYAFKSETEFRGRKTSKLSFLR